MEMSVEHQKLLGFGNGSGMEVQARETWFADIDYKAWQMRWFL